MRKKSPDFDSPWKEALERFLPEFLAFFFPEVWSAINWKRGYLSLDKELHQVIRKSEVGRRLADKLFKAWRKDGTEAWLLIHIEVQGKRESKFPERMYVYQYRIFDRYHHPVVSLAVLCDDDPAWKPDRFECDELGCGVTFRFLPAKMLDYQGKETVLERDRNPFAAIVLAQLKAMETRKSPQDRLSWKLRVFKGLYERGLPVEQARQLLGLIDWMLDLPEELEKKFDTEVHRFEEERGMQYVPSYERKAHNEGLRKGLLQGIDLAVQAKFGDAGKPLMREIAAIKEMKILEKVMRALMAGKSADAILKLVRS